MAQLNQAASWGRDFCHWQGSPGRVLSSCAKGTATDSQSFSRIDVSSVQYVALSISGGETCRLLNQSMAPETLALYFCSGPTELLQLPQDLVLYTSLPRTLILLHESFAYISITLCYTVERPSCGQMWLPNLVRPDMDTLGAVR
jgi:hypothetical protein